MTNVTRRALMIATWRGLGEPRVGAKELRRMQRALTSEFGATGIESPAAIARIVADEGAQLMHPEIIEFDARWRESQIKKRANAFAVVDPLLANEALSLEKAEARILDLEQLRQECENAYDREALSYLKAIAVQARESAELRSRQENADHLTQFEQGEIAGWFKVWLQTPALFADWIELRKRSAEFSRRFAKNQIEPT